MSRHAVPRRSTQQIAAHVAAHAGKGVEKLRRARFMPRVALSPGIDQIVCLRRERRDLVRAPLAHRRHLRGGFPHGDAQRPERDERLGIDVLLGQLLRRLHRDGEVQVRRRVLDAGVAEQADDVAHLHVHAGLKRKVGQGRRAVYRRPHALSPARPLAGACAPASVVQRIFFLKI